MIKTPLVGFILCVAVGCASAQSASSEADARADALLAKLTLEQKIELIGGQDSMYIRAMPGIGLPRLKMSDGPVGVRTWGTSNAYAGGIGLAASWDPDLARKIGVSLGKDARARGVNFLLGPGVNIYRAPMNGRNFEYFGEDPFLAATMVVPYIEGVQSQGVVATVKHYAANNSEQDRHNIDSWVDERTLREIYLPAFEAAVTQAQVGAVMNSYNLLNGQHATQNAFLNLQVLKHDWGFQGILMSDWNATYDGVAAAKNGLDLEMPSAKFMDAATLLPAVKSGEVPEATIDDKVRRILRVALEYHFLDRPQLDATIPLYSQEARAIALRSAEESIVLLKNDGNLLPLDASRVRRVAVIGPDAYPAVPGGGGSSKVTAFDPVSILTGVSDALAGKAVVTWSKGVKDFEEIAHDCKWARDPQGDRMGLREDTFPSRDFTGTPTHASVQRLDQFAGPGFGAEHPPRYSKRYTGYILPAKSGGYALVVAGSRRDSYQVYVDGKEVLDQPSRENQAPRSTEVMLEAGKPAEVRLDYVPIGSRNDIAFGFIASNDLVDPQAVATAAKADVAVVSVGFDPRYEGEGFDRSYGLPTGQDRLIRAIEAANPHTVVVLTAGGSVATSTWIDQTPVFIHSFYGGQEAGRGLAKVLLGEIDPSGKLPISFEKQVEDNPTLTHYYAAKGGTRVDYAEGVFLGYRHYDRSATKPLFPFGFGLSYTRFAFSDLELSPANPSADSPVTVRFTVRNTGDRAGAEVAQVYVADPSATVERPVRELKGLERIALQPGESRQLTLQLGKRAFAYWDANGHDWKVDPGTFTVSVGDSSANLPLHADLQLR